MKVWHKLEQGIGLHQNVPELLSCRDSFRYSTKTTVISCFLVKVIPSNAMFSPSTLLWKSEIYGHKISIDECLSGKFETLDGDSFGTLITPSHQHLENSSPSKRRQTLTSLGKRRSWHLMSRRLASRRSGWEAAGQVFFQTSRSTVRWKMLRNEPWGWWMSHSSWSPSPQDWCLGAWRKTEEEKDTSFDVHPKVLTVVQRPN